jgi:hypothetical protein
MARCGGDIADHRSAFWQNELDEFGNEISRGVTALHVTTITKRLIADRPATFAASLATKTSELQHAAREEASMISVGRCAFGLVLSTFGWLSAASAQEPNASCQAIRNACRDAGFAVGGPPGERLMIDCFEPLVHGAARAPGGARAFPDIPAPLANSCQATLGSAATVANQPAPRTPSPLRPAAAPRLEVDLRGEIEKLGLPV